MASNDVRLACADTLTAATTRPARSRIGAASARNPSSNSWFTSAHPCARTLPISVRSAAADVTVRAVSGASATTDRYASRSSSAAPASRTRPIDVA
jgi:hypothetical protein